MSGELRLGQFRWTVTADDDLVIGSPLNAGLKNTKYIVFQVTNKTGYDVNPHIRCDWDTVRVDPRTGTPGMWVVRFSNDGSNIADFAYINLPNTFTQVNTFNNSVTFNDNVRFTNTVVFTAPVNISIANMRLAGLSNSRALVTDANGLLQSSVTTLTELSYLSGATTNIQQQLNTKAPLVSPALTGIPTAPTAPVGTNTEQIATTAFVQMNAASGVGLKGYDGRSIVFTDSVTGQSYRITIWNGVVSIMPYYIPGTGYIILKDVATAENFKLTFKSGILALEPTDLNGVYSYTVYDYANNNHHRLYLENHTLRNRPE